MSRIEDHHLAVVEKSKPATVLLWDVDSRSRLAAIQISTEDGEIWSMSFSPDESELATGSVDGVARIWEVASGRLIRSLEGHRGRVTVVYSPDGRYIATAGLRGSYDREPSLAPNRPWSEHFPDSWPFLVKIPRAGEEPPANVDPAEFLADQYRNTIVVKLWDRSSGRELATVESHARGSIAFSPDASLLAINCGHHVEVWRLGAEPLSQLRTLIPQVERRNSPYNGSDGPLAFSADSRHVAAGHSGEVVALWDLPAAKGEQFRTKLWLHSLHFADAGRELAVGRVNYGFLGSGASTIRSTVTLE